MKTIYILRHEECEGTGYIGGGSDVPLSQLGMANAKETSEHIENISFDRIFTSPLKRCLSTLEPIMESRNWKPLPNKDPRLKELDFGIWEGKNWDSIETNYPKSLNRWLNAPAEEQPPGGETLFQLHERVEAFWKEWIVEGSGKTILIVSHGGPIRTMLSILTGGGIDSHWTFGIDRGRFCIINMYDDNKCQIMGTNMKWAGLSC